MAALPPADGAASDEQWDVVVVGAGAAGMAAALFAAIRNAKVLLVEKSEFVGGTAALSAGTIWIPNTSHSREVGAEDTPERAATYLQNVVGNRSGADMREAFLANGPAAARELEAHSDLKLRAHAYHPDYLSEVEGAALKGRALEPLPFDGRELGKRFALLRSPLPEFTILGGMMVDRVDIGHLLRLFKSSASTLYATKLLLRHARDRIFHSRGTRLVMGNALIGRLLRSLDVRGVEIRFNTTVSKILVNSDGAVGGVVLRGTDGSRTVAISGGLILAGGGFNRHSQRRRELLSGVEVGWASAAEGTTGENQDRALEVGARLGGAELNAAFLAPVSIRTRRDGSTAVFPHFVLDRGKPGTIVVDRQGKRFVNESISYHQFGLAMLASADRSAIPAFLIADAVAIRKYGLGMVRPGARGLKPYLDDGYLVTASTIGELASRLGIDPEGLRESIARMNRFAESGEDPDFGRGSTAYQRNTGDAGAGGKNPNLGPIATPPFYALRLYPSDIGASTGLVTDNHARVLGAGDRPIAGLYACGNDMQSIMGGVYPGPGITLGPALTFAYLAAADAAVRGQQSRQAVDTGTRS
jgi:succinate dehydrogenase/fumarate reductase flavoprotein subunit